MSEPSLEQKRKWWKFYWLPSGTPKQIAKRGLLISITFGVLGSIFPEGVVVRALSDVFATYGILLLLMALIVWIKNRGKKKQGESTEEV